MIRHASSPGVDTTTVERTVAESLRATDAMCEIYILVYVETTLLIVGSSIAAVFPLFRNINIRLQGTYGNGRTESSNATPLRTFGQGTSKRPKKAVEDDETILTRDDAVQNTSNTFLEGIIRTTNVVQTWGPAELESQSRTRQLGLPPGMT